MAEGHRLAVQYEHARVEARVDRVRPGAARLAEQPEFGGARHDRDELEHRARVGAQPGDARGHRVAHAAGHLAARRGQRLRDEERIAAGEGAQARAVAARSAGEERDRALGQRRGLDARKALARERGEEAAELRPLGQPVRATGHDEAAARPHQPAREERQQVEGGVVGPVQVLHHEHRGRAGAHLVEERPEHLLARRGALQRRAHRAVDLARHVPQRAHRPRRHERIADAPQHPVAPALRARGGHQRGLADARLARHEDDASGRAGGVQRRVEHARSSSRSRSCTGALASNGVGHVGARQPTGRGGGAGGRRGVVAPSEHAERDLRQRDQRRRDDDEQHADHQATAVHAATRTACRPRWATTTGTRPSVAYSDATPSRPRP